MQPESRSAHLVTSSSRGLLLISSSLEVLFGFMAAYCYEDKGVCHSKQEDRCVFQTDKKKPDTLAASKVPLQSPGFHAKRREIQGTQSSAVTQAESLKEQFDISGNIRIFFLVELD